MATLKKIVRLSYEQLSTLRAEGSITVGGETITYDENALYVTPAEETSFVKSIGTYVDGDTVALDVNTVDTETSDVTPSQIPLPLADTTHAGMMSKEDKTALAGKVDVAQGTANAGKVLGIDSQGNVIPITPSSGGATLYIHELYFEGDRISDYTGVYVYVEGYIQIINADKTPISYTTLRGGNYICNGIFREYNVEGGSQRNFPLVHAQFGYYEDAGSRAYVGSILFANLYVGTLEIFEFDTDIGLLNMTTLTDTVTEIKLS